MSPPRPRKPRVVDGVELVENLYPDNRARPGRWRYRRPDGTWKVFQAATVQEANRFATANNAARGHYVPVPPDKPQLGYLLYYIPHYIDWRETQDPSLKSKRSWDNRKYDLYNLAETFAATPMNALRWEQIRDWWDTLGPHVQKPRHAEYRRFFNWMMGHGRCTGLKYNPFSRQTIRDLGCTSRPRHAKSASPSQCPSSGTFTGAREARATPACRRPWPSPC